MDHEVKNEFDVVLAPYIILQLPFGEMRMGLSIDVTNMSISHTYMNWRCHVDR